MTVKLSFKTRQQESRRDHSHHDYSGLSEEMCVIRLNSLSSFSHKLGSSINNVSRMHVNSLSDKPVTLQPFSAHCLVLGDFHSFYQLYPWQLLTE